MANVAIENGFTTSIIYQQIRFVDQHGLLLLADNTLS